MKKKSLFSKETIFTKRHVLKHCPCNQIILCLYENWYYNYVLNYYFKVRNYIKKKLWLALNYRTSLTVEAMTMNFQLILLEKKKMVKMLNINIFHEKATGKGEKKKSQETFPSPLQQVKESLSLQHRSTLFIFSLTCTFSPGSVLLPWCTTKRTFQGVRVAMYSLWFCFLIFSWL